MTQAFIRTNILPNGTIQATGFHSQNGRIIESFSRSGPTLEYAMRELTALADSRDIQIIGNPLPRSRCSIEPELREELFRRFRDRKCPGYFGTNSRAWLRLHIAAIRQGKAFGHRSY